MAQNTTTLPDTDRADTNNQSDAEQNTGGGHTLLSTAERTHLCRQLAAQTDSLIETASLAVLLDHLFAVCDSKGRWALEDEIHLIKRQLMIDNTEALHTALNSASEAVIGGLQADTGELDNSADGEGSGDDNEDDNKGGGQHSSEDIEAEIQRRVERKTRRIEEKANAPYESQGNWHGSETFQLLPEVEMYHAALALGEDAGGTYFVGLFIFLLEHIGKLAFEKRFNDLEFAVSEISKRMIKSCNGALDLGVTAIREDASKHLTESTAWLLSLRAHSLSEKLYKHLEESDRSKRDADAD